MSISRKKLLLVASKTNGRCFYCNRIGEVVDHFISRKEWTEPVGIPKSIVDELATLFSDEGYCDSLWNLVLACHKCNSKKLAKNPCDFMGEGMYGYHIAWSRLDRANYRLKNVDMMV